MQRCVTVVTLKLEFVFEIMGFSVVLLLCNENHKCAEVVKKKNATLCGIPMRPFDCTLNSVLHSKASSVIILICKHTKAYISLPHLHYLAG